MRDVGALSVRLLFVTVQLDLFATLVVYLELENRITDLFTTRNRVILLVRNRGDEGRVRRTTAAG